MTRRGGSRLLLVLAIPILTSASARAAEVRFHRTAVVTTSMVRLGDIAQITEADPEKARQLQEVVISPAPPPGEERRIELSDIRARMRAQGVNFTATQLTGSSLVVVRREGDAAAAPQVTPVAQVRAQRAEERVAQAVQSYLTRIAPELGHSQVSVQLPSNQAAALAEAAARGYEVRGGKPPWDLPQSLLIRYLDAREQIQEVSITCRITPRPLILTAARPISRGQIIEAHDLQLEAGEAGASGIGSPEELVGKEARNAIRTGEIIRPQDVRDVPLIRSNDIVTVYSRAPGVVVQRQYKATSQGARGETVTLVGLEDRREKLLARVIGYHEAETLDSPPSGLIPSAPATVGPRRAAPSRGPQTEFRGRELSLSPRGMRR